MKKIFVFSMLVLLGSFGLNVFAQDSITTTTDSISAPAVKSITLQKGDANLLKWTVDGYSKNGFKVVWSLHENPTYPLRDGDKYHYYADPNKNTDNVEPFNGIGVYYVRVCEYINDVCGVYSNQVKVEFSNRGGDLKPGTNNPVIKIDNNNKGMMNNNQDMMNGNNTNNITDPSQLPSGYEKISSIDDIKNYEKIIKVGDTDLYGIKMTVKIPDGKEWIKSLADVKYFKNIQKVGDHLYGVRISDEKKLQLQKRINELNTQLQKLQDQITQLTTQLSSVQ